MDGELVQRDIRIYFLDAVSNVPLQERLSVAVYDNDQKLAFEGETEANGCLIIAGKTSLSPSGNAHHIEVRDYRVAGDGSVDLSAPEDQWVSLSRLIRTRIRLLDVATEEPVVGAVIESVGAYAGNARLGVFESVTRRDGGTRPLVSATDSAGEVDLGLTAVGEVIELVVSARGYKPLVAEIVPAAVPKERDGGGVKTLFAFPAEPSDRLVALATSTLGPSQDDRWELYRQSRRERAGAGWPSFHRIGAAPINEGIEFSAEDGGSDRFAFDVWIDGSKIHYDCDVSLEGRVDNISLAEYSGPRSHFVLPAERGGATRLELHGTVTPTETVKRGAFSFIQELCGSKADAERLTMYVPSCEELVALLIYDDGRQVQVAKKAFTAGSELTFGSPTERDLIELAIVSGLTLGAVMEVTSNDAERERFALTLNESGQYMADVPRSFRYFTVRSTDGVTFKVQAVAPVATDHITISLEPDGLVACHVLVRDDTGAALPFFPFRLIPDPSAPDRLALDSSMTSPTGEALFRISVNDVLFRRSDRDGRVRLLAPPGAYLIDQADTHVRTLGSGLRWVLNPPTSKLSVYDGMGEVEVVFESLRSVTLDFGGNVRDKLPLVVSFDAGWRKREVLARDCTLLLGSGAYSLYVTDRQGIRSGPFAIAPGHQDASVIIEL
ncbi:MAG: hypothetical protein GY722_26060 [bacterium]|nr:hypothetical protein [bacterium]